MIPPRIRTAFYVSLAIGFLRSMAGKLLRPAPRPHATRAFSIFAEPDGTRHAVWLAVVYEDPAFCYSLIARCWDICDNSTIRYFVEDHGPHFLQKPEIYLSRSGDRLSCNRSVKEVIACLDVALSQTVGRNKYEIK